MRTIVAGFACRRERDAECRPLSSCSSLSEPVVTHQKSGEKSPARGDAEQRDVNAVGNRVGRRVPRDTEFDGGAENPAQVEEHPKDAKVSTLGPFGGVGQRQTPLRGPQEGSAASENGAARYHETGVAVYVVREQGAHADCAAVRIRRADFFGLLYKKGTHESIRTLRLRRRFGNRFDSRSLLPQHQRQRMCSTRQCWHRWQLSGRVAL